jgi:hypothetical protein
MLIDNSYVTLLSLFLQYFAQSIWTPLDCLDSIWTLPKIQPCIFLDKVYWIVLGLQTTKQVVDSQKSKVHLVLSLLSLEEFKP